MNNRDESEIAVGDSAKSLWPSPSRSCGHGSCPKLYGLQDLFVIGPCLEWARGSADEVALDGRSRATEQRPQKGQRNNGCRRGNGCICSSFVVHMLAERLRLDRTQPIILFLHRGGFGADGVLGGHRSICVHQTGRPCQESA
jgi:hypothetical protein